jgi:hypothetical protein
LTVDVLYPLAYTLFYSLLTTFLLQRAFAAQHWAQRLNALPFGALAGDFLENIGIVILLSIHPAQPWGLGFYLQIVNGLKWLFAGASVAILVFALGAFVWRKASRWIDPAKNRLAG